MMSQAQKILWIIALNYWGCVIFAHTCAMFSENDHSCTAFCHVRDYFITQHRRAPSESGLDHSKYTYWMSPAQKMANLHSQIASQVFATAVAHLLYVPLC
jgi:hypothetical protein